MSACKDAATTNTTTVPASFSVLSNWASLSSGDNTNVVLYRLTKSCTRSFIKYENNAAFNCELVSKNQTNVPAELQPTAAYDTLSFRLDLHYGPEQALLAQASLHQFNQTLVAGTSRLINFSCPFQSNPEPVFFWRVAYVSYNNESRVQRQSAPDGRRRLSTTEFLPSSKDYSIPSNLDIGQYIFECKAQTLGLVNNASSPVRFYLSIIRKCYRNFTK